MVRITSILLCCLLSFATAAIGQTASDTVRMLASGDTVKVAADTVKKELIVKGADTIKSAQTKKHKFEPVAKKAGLFSAILPGTGQIYNRQYWKAPVIYGGAAVAVYFFNYNYDKYITYKKAYFGRLNNGGNSTAEETEEMKRYTTADLKTLQDEYRKFLDMTVMLSAVGYAAQVIDAIVSAHLKNFDMSRDISFQFKPVFQPNINGPGAGIGIAMNFR